LPQREAPDLGEGGPKPAKQNTESDRRPKKAESSGKKGQKSRFNVVFY